MPRGPRKQSEQGYYHVMLRGAGRQILFEEDRDRHEFLGHLTDAMPLFCIELIAWCLMDNHVHLLVCDPKNQLASFMHAVSTRYALYYNAKSGHVGPVFQGRFKSKPIDTDEYLLQAVRYIHDNPLELGLTREAYRWSSYREYANEPRIVETEPVLALIGGKSSFASFSSCGREDSYTPYEPGRLPETEAMRAIRRVLSERGLAPSEIKALHPIERNQMLVRLHDLGLSVRQIERLTGVGRYTISRIANDRRLVETG